MAFVQRACLLLVALLYAVVGRVDATGRGPPGVIVPDLSSSVRAVFDMGGVRGFVQFFQKNRHEPVEIHVNLEGLDQFTDSYPWHVHDFPVRYALLNDYPCSPDEVGGHYDPLDAISNPNYDTDCNMDPTECEVGDFSGKLGLLANDQQWQTFVDPNLSLFGPLSIVGRSLVIHRGIPPENRWICANIEYYDSNVEILRASLIPASTIAQYEGEVVIYKGKGRDDATIYVDVRTNDPNLEDHEWNLRLGQSEMNCPGFGATVYGRAPGFDYGAAGCDSLKQRACGIGDFTQKCGPIVFNSEGRGRNFCTDNQLGSIPTDNLLRQAVSVTITDLSGAIRACGQLMKAKPRQARAILRDSTVYGDISFHQASPYDLTMAISYITGIRGRNVSLQIHQGDDTCTPQGTLLRRPGPSYVGRPIGTVKTGDAVILGNLGPKITIPPQSHRYLESTPTPYLPLFGPYSIVGNTLVLIDDNTGAILACGLINDMSPKSLVSSLMGF